MLTDKEKVALSSLLVCAAYNEHKTETKKREPDPEQAGSVLAALCELGAPRVYPVPARHQAAFYDIAKSISALFSPFAAGERGRVVITPCRAMVGDLAPRRIGERGVGYSYLFSISGGITREAVRGVILPEGVCYSSLACTDSAGKPTDFSFGVLAEHTPRQSIYDSLDSVAAIPRDHWTLPPNEREDYSEMARVMRESLAQDDAKLYLPSLPEGRFARDGDDFAVTRVDVTAYRKTSDGGGVLDDRAKSAIVLSPHKNVVFLLRALTYNYLNEASVCLQNVDMAARAEEFLNGLSAYCREYCSRPGAFPTSGGQGPGPA